MAGTIVEPTKTNHREITLDLSAAAGPAAGERQEDDQGRQEDRKTDGEGKGGIGGEGRGRDVPSRRFSPFTLLLYKWGYHSRGLKDGGVFFFFCGGGVVMEGQRRIKGAGSCYGTRDGSGKTGTDLNGRHLLGCAGRVVVEGRDEGERGVVLLQTALNGRLRAGVNWVRMVWRVGGGEI